MTYSSPMDSYISARGRALAIQILVAIQLVMHAVVMIGWIAGLVWVGSDATSAISAFGLATVVSGFEGLLFLAALIVFMTWVYRAIANLPALGSMTCRFTPSGAVWSFFIPFVNLVRGHQVMATIWTESQPAAMNDFGYHLPRKTAIVNWWWALWLIYRVGERFVDVGTVNVSSLRTAAVAQLVLLGFCGVAGVLFLLMVRGAQSRQDAMWEDLERKRSVPQPTAQYLR